MLQLPEQGKGSLDSMGDGLVAFTPVVGRNRVTTLKVHARLRDLEQWHTRFIDGQGARQGA